MTASACEPDIIGAIAVLQSAFQAMPLPHGVVSFVEAGLRRVPGVARAELHLEVEPLPVDEPAVAAQHGRMWVETAYARFGWLDLTLTDQDAFAPYEPYVLNLVNAVALHVETAHQQAQLERMVAELRETDRKKDEFLGVLSHELRNPLAPIRNSIYVLERVEPRSAHAVGAMDVIRRQTEHLTRLVDDLLDAKRLSTGKFRLHPVRMDLGQVVRETVDDLRATLAQRSLSVEVHTPTDPLWVNGDPTRLTQLVGNLVQNAAKFTNAGGHVDVSVGLREDLVEIRVRDDGVGVAPELLPSMFEPFVQGENTIHRTRGGLGLGLALVRGIAELHGGSVVAKSEGVGRGTEFVVSLPILARTSADSTAASPAARTSRRRVLVIEDNRDAGESLRDVLAAIGGHDVRLEHDGYRGLVAAAEDSPDVIICDLGLPGIDGYELATRLRRASGPEKAARLIALSGYAAPEDVERSIRAGFDYHVAKPADLARLLNLVGQASPSGAAPTIPEALATGHHEVDEQHAAILAEAARLRRAGPGAIRESLHFLQHHTRSHFEYEEKLMEDVGYERAAVHQRQHLAFVAEFLRLRAAIERDGPTQGNVSALATAVEKWVAEHVLDEDRRFAEFLRSRNAAAA